MKKNLTRRRGAYIVSAVLIVVGLGLLLWLSQEDSQPQSTSQPTQTSEQPTDNEKRKDNNNSQTEQTSQDTNKYLVIDEWGVKFTLTPAIADATYKLDNPADDSALLVTQRVVKISDTQYECNMADESITLARAKPGDDRFGAPWTEEQLKEIGTKHGQYYYFIETGQPCFGNNPDAFQNAMDEINGIAEQFKQAVKTISNAN